MSVLITLILSHYLQKSIVFMIFTWIAFGCSNVVEEAWGWEVLTIFWFGADRVFTQVFLWVGLQVMVIDIEFFCLDPCVLFVPEFFVLLFL